MSGIMNLGLNDWVTCPFDPVHRLKYSKFHNHFVKCKRNHPDDRRKQCPYNAAELVEPEKMEDHIQNCKYKILFVKRNDSTYNLPEYDAPCHIDLVDSSKPIRSANESSDEEIDSVSVIRLNFDGQPVRVSESNKLGIQTSMKKIELPIEKRSFGRGTALREKLEQMSQMTSTSSFTTTYSSLGRGALYAKYRN